MNVCLRFVGGPLDGEFRFDDASEMPVDDPTAMQARAFYDLTNNGEVGKATMGLSPAAIRVLMSNSANALGGSGAHAHKYRVVARQEDGNVVYVRAERFS